MLFPDLINKYCRPYNESLVIIENNAEGSMVATQLHYDIEYPNVFVQGMTKSTDIGITMSKKIKTSRLFNTKRTCWKKIDCL